MFLRDDLVADFARVAIRDPVQLRNQLRRTDVGGWVAVALQTHRHVERLFLPDFYHLVDAAVAAYATHPGCDMRAMVKINVVRQEVNFFPRYRIAGFIGLPDHFKARALVLDLLVTAHADLG